MQGNGRGGHLIPGLIALFLQKIDDSLVSSWIELS
jgi:hypothetical protein